MSWKTILSRWAAYQAVGRLPRIIHHDLKRRSCLLSASIVKCLSIYPCFIFTYCVPFYVLFSASIFFLVFGFQFCVTAFKVENEPPTSDELNAVASSMRATHLPNSKEGCLSQLLIE